MAVFHSYIDITRGYLLFSPPSEEIAESPSLAGASERTRRRKKNACFMGYFFWVILYDIYIYIHIYIYMFLFICLFIYLLFCLSIYLFICDLYIHIYIVKDVNTYEYSGLGLRRYLSPKFARTLFHLFPSEISQPCLMTLEVISH